MNSARLITVILTGLISAGASQAEEVSNTMIPRPVHTVAGADWSGFYIGAHAGVSRGDSRWTRPAGPGLAGPSPRFPASGDQSGMFAGGTLGYNHQIGTLVLGLEGDLSLASNYSSAVCGGVWGRGAPLTLIAPGVTAAGGWHCQAWANLYGSVAARAGYATGRSLFYGKAGLAYAHTRFAADDLLYLDMAGETSTRRTHASGSEHVFGWTLGAGIEYALGGAWSAKAEYDYYGFPGRRWSGFNPDYAAVQGAKVSQGTHIVKFGVNYRLGGDFGDAASSPPVASDVSGEFGARLGITAGDLDYRLGDPFVPGQRNSRLTWVDQKGAAIEAFGRLDHASGVFVKGILGGVELFRNPMYDEDFPPLETVYSNTLSRTGDSHGVYATADIGWTYNGPCWSAGVFFGYSHNEQQMHARGCSQVAGGDICADIGEQMPANASVLGRHERWQGVRIGMVANVDVTDRLKLTADMAYLPSLKFNGRDNHWARPDINPMADRGDGHGYQLEAVASYRVTDRMSLGIGARHWNATAKAQVVFPGLPPSPTKVKSERSTIFAQVSYAFGGGR